MSVQQLLWGLSFQPELFQKWQAGAHSYMIEIQIIYILIIRFLVYPLSPPSFCSLKLRTRCIGILPRNQGSWMRWGRCNWLLHSCVRDLASILFYLLTQKWGIKSHATFYRFLRELCKKRFFWCRIMNCKVVKKW